MFQYRLFIFLLLSTNVFSADFIFKIPPPNEVLERQGNYSSYELSSNFNILVWNNFKGDKKGWKKDFNNLISNKNILLLQEYYSVNMTDFNNSENFIYDIATSFIYSRKDDAKTGVSTGSSANPFKVFFDRSYYREPIIGTPKVSLFTQYDLENCNDTLLVVNTHAINFVGYKKFKHQMRSIANKISMHNGPVIWAGDFNTWTKKKLNGLKYIAKSIGLTMVGKYINDQRLRVFKKPLDHIFYRGLELTKALVKANIESSDHKPLVASFQTKCNEFRVAKR